MPTPNVLVTNVLFELLSTYQDPLRKTEMSALPSPSKSDQLGPPLTIVAPRNVRTWPIGFAIASVLLPAKSNPTAWGFVETSSTISDPESPLSKKFFPPFAIII